MIFNSRKVASPEMDMTDFATPTRVPESESTFDSSDYEQMHPDFAREHQPSSNSEITSMGGDDPETAEERADDEKVGTYGNGSDNINVVECPTCNGDSIHNNDKFPIYVATHCPGCTDNDCGSKQSDVEPDCMGCKLGKKKCPGRERAYYKGDPNAVCPTCKNVGEIAKRSNHCLNCDNPRCTGPDPVNPGHCKSCEDHDLPGADNHLPSMNFSEAQQQVHDPSDEDDDEDFVGQREAIGQDSSKVDSPTSSYDSSDAFDDGSDVSDAHILTTSGPSYDDDDEDEEEAPKAIRQEPTKKYTKHDPWCTCGGSGVESRPEVIAAINKSDEFLNGIKNINTTPIVGKDPVSVRKQQEAIDKAKDDFIHEQYACKEEQ
jgi:hypothetical protein